MSTHQSQHDERANKTVAEWVGPDWISSMRDIETSYLVSHPAKNYPTYFDILLGRLQHRALWVWISASLLCTGLAYAFYLRTGLNKFLGTFTFLALGIGVTPIAMRAGYSIILNWKIIIPDFIKDGYERRFDIYDWVDRQFDEFARSHIPVFFGGAYALFALAVFALSGAFESLTSPLAVTCRIIVLVSGFACGIGLCTIGYLGRLIWRLGQYDVRISEHGFGILSTGRTLLKCYLIIAIVWCVYTGSATGGLKQGWVPIALLTLPAVTFFVGSFIVCQIPLHERMVIAKRMELCRLEDLLARLAPHTYSDLDKERTEKIKFVNSEVQRVKNLPEWPFSLGSISGILISALLAVAQKILRLALSEIHLT